MELGLLEASEVQKEAIPTLLRGEDAIVGSQTGSGKTLAYLLPAIQRQKLMEEEMMVGMPKPYRPRILVLVPNRELCDQVSAIAKSLAHSIKFSATSITGGEKLRLQRRRLAEGIDILVATPGRLKAFRTAQRVHLSEVHTCILDEADTLIESGFAAEVRDVLRTLRRRRETDEAPVQFVAVGATLNQRVRKQLGRLFPGATEVAVSSLHRPADSAEHRFVEHKGLNKYTTLMEVLKRDPPSDTSQALIFCNTTDSARATQHALREHGFVAAVLHRDVPAGQRAQNFAAFREGRANVMVATDIFARGLDIRSVEHVINFDFPRRSADFLHRVGRTARAGSRGLVTSIVAKHDKVLARAIQRAVGNDEEVSSLSLGRNARGEEMRERDPTTYLDAASTDPWDQAQSVAAHGGAGAVAVGRGGGRRREGERGKARAATPWDNAWEEELDRRYRAVGAVAPAAGDGQEGVGGSSSVRRVAVSKEAALRNSGSEIPLLREVVSREREQGAGRAPAQRGKRGEFGRMGTPRPEAGQSGWAERSKSLGQGKFVSRLHQEKRKVPGGIRAKTRAARSALEKKGLDVEEAKRRSGRSGKAARKRGGDGNAMPKNMILKTPGRSGRK